MSIRPQGWQPSQPQPTPNQLVEAALEEIQAEQRARRQALEQRQAEREAEREQRKIQHAHEAAIVVDQARRAAKLRDEGLTVQEVATALGLGMSTAYDRIGRGNSIVKAWPK